ncbi:hypothetical protein L9F63_015248 [Diploptera punctata]|uniref:Peroxisomal membrane protein PEX13 n=1 Tax=Diploptera punctata TaxID=6984 RepID=A0AAD8EK50_DIPPU|nr:hypothetical protein L9F63_015248 [Diploptera punctata]
MAAPPKPWEIGGANSRSMQNIPTVQNVTETNRLQSSQTPVTANVMPAGTVMSGRRVVRSIPAPPPRPHRPLVRQSYIPSSGYNTPFSSYGSYGTGYGGYSGLGYYGNSYGGYSGYGGYGMNRFGYNMPGNGNDPENRFIQMAEESSRPAFQSIESIVHAFGSVSFMLESTFTAMHSSFRAVLSVAENFGRLRTTFGQFFSTFAIFRLLRWLYKKLMYMLGIQKVNPGREEIWQQAVSGATALPPGADAKSVRSSWPVIMFMAIMCSGPYLVWKLVNSLSNMNVPNSYDPKDWKKSKDAAYTAVGLYDFVAETNQELSFRAGQKLLVAPKELQPRDLRGWMLATADGQKVGLVPYNYLKFAAINYAKPQHIERAQTSTLPQNQGSLLQAGIEQMTAINQDIPTANELPADIPPPIMQTGWVPQPVVPLVQEGSDWIPKTTEEIPPDSNIPNPQLPP